MGTSAINLRLAKRGKWNSQFQTLDKKFKKRRWVLWIVFNVCLKKAVVFHAAFYCFVQVQIFRRSGGKRIAK